LALSHEGAPGTHKTTRQIAREPAFRRGQWDASYSRHSAKVSEETILAWSGIQQSITDQDINQWRNRLNARVKLGKPKANTLSICCDVFVQ